MAKKKTKKKLKKVTKKFAKTKTKKKVKTEPRVAKTKPVRKRKQVKLKGYDMTRNTAILFGLRPTIDGNQYCVSYDFSITRPGPESVCGYGDTVLEAYKNFEVSFCNQTIMKHETKTPPIGVTETLPSTEETIDLDDILN